MQEINEKIEKGSENLKTKPETPNTDGEYGVDNNDTLESEKITEYDYSDESSIEKLHDVIDCLSSEEALSALEAIRRTHGVGNTLKLMGFKEWFDKAFFPVLQNFAVESFAKLYVERDADENITVATVYKGNIIKNLIMDCQSYTKYRPNETTGGIFVSWRRKEELPTGA